MFKFNKKIKIDGILLSTANPVRIIAEMGVNHDGSLAKAKKLIDAACFAGADFVKFQTFTAEEFMADKKQIYQYKVRGKIKRESMYDMFKRLELPYAWHKELKQYCQKKNIGFLSTPCDCRAVDLLDKLKVKAFKISSEDLINIPLLKYVAQKKKVVICSTGMADQKEIEIAVRLFKRHQNKKLILMHCTSIYPTPSDEVNLLRMQQLAKTHNVLTGFSDHTQGNEAALGAVYLGAVLIEKHFTLSKKSSGPDHAFSIEPKELKNLIKEIRYAEKLKGTGEIKETKTEKKERLKFRRSIVANADYPAGTKIQDKHLTFKRPGHGLKPYQKDEIIGGILKRCVQKDQQIRKTMVKF